MECFARNAYRSHFRKMDWPVLHPDRSTCRDLYFACFDQRVHAVVEAVPIREPDFPKSG
jgi:hypothetical protein